MSKLRAKTLKAYHLHLDGRDWGLFVQEDEWEGFKSLKKIDGSGQKLIVGRDPESGAGLFSEIFGEIFNDGEQELRIVAGSPDLMLELKSSAEKEKPTNTVLELIAKERERQVNEEGFTAEHDDKYHGSELCLAALCYLLMLDDIGRNRRHPPGNPPPDWPWDADYWKPSTPERNLTKAGALIVAEMERRNRSAPGDKQ